MFRSSDPYQAVGRGFAFFRLMVMRSELSDPAASMPNVTVESSGMFVKAWNSASFVRRVLSMVIADRSCLERSLHA